MKNVILLGASNSVMVNGLSKGLKETFAHGGGGVEFHNLALGGCFSDQKICALLENEALVKKADLIIVETNINETYGLIYGSKFKALQRDFEPLCKMLANLKASILFILLPLHDDKVKIINHLNLLQIKKYDFNFIDMQSFYEKHHLNKFFATTDKAHQIAPIMKTLGQNIAKNYSAFKRYNFNKHKVPNFHLCKVEELFENATKMEKDFRKNSLFEAEIYKLDKTLKLKFKKDFKGFLLLAFGTWNEKAKGDLTSFASVIFENKNHKSVKFIIGDWLSFIKLENAFLIDDESFLSFNALNEKQSEASDMIFLDGTYKNTVDFMCLTNQFLLVKPDENFRLDAHYDLEKLANLKVEIDEKYNFSHLIPDTVLFKELIEAYNARMDGVKIAPFQNEIENLKLELNKLKIKPIQTHLAYKLGRVIIENYRNFWGLLGLFFVLSYTAKKHKKEEVLSCDENEKQILSYQLGLALIKAHKSWYKGGYVWFIFKAFSLKKKFKR